TDDLTLMPDGGGWLMVEFGGENTEEADEKAKKLIEELENEDDAPNCSLFDDRDQEEMLWKVREAGLGASAFVPGRRDAWPGWEDSAVPPDNVSEYLQDLKDLFHEYDYSAALYG